mmetsp:Transcript_31913/g.60007  ORF Transcript_31913/g.60007 Transcript_31913/m.60007 type:complete len:252 (+) Transcript_31913:1370-2125(+)
MLRRATRCGSRTPPPLDQAHEAQSVVSRAGEQQVFEQAGAADVAGVVADGVQLVVAVAPGVVEREALHECLVPCTVRGEGGVPPPAQLHALPDIVVFRYGGLELLAHARHAADVPVQQKLQDVPQSLVRQRQDVESGYGAALALHRGRGRELKHKVELRVRRRGRCRQVPALGRLVGCGGGGGRTCRTSRVLLLVPPLSLALHGRHLLLHLLLQPALLGLRFRVLLADADGKVDAGCVVVVVRPQVLHPAS